MIERTVRVFDLVAEAHPLRDRVLVLDNDDDSGHLERLAADLAVELRVSARARGVLPPRAARAPADRLHAEPRR